MRSSHVEIASPCHESWDAMSGGEARRFCGVCQKDVHNLSAMAHAEAAALLRERSGERRCVRYTSEADGTLRFRDLVPRASLTRKLVRTAFAATMLAACTPHSEGLAPRGLGETVIETIRAATVATADGGCDYSTGPFTTFHLPPGHVLCREGEAVERTRIVEPPAPPRPMMGEPRMVPEPPPVIDPQPRMRMGDAVMVPEPVDPFVPCDPKPGFAPPPPDSPSPERVGEWIGPTAKPPAAPPIEPRERVLMGDIAGPEPEPARPRKMGEIVPFDE